MRDGFKFGDILQNGWAGEGNPQKVGIFVVRKHRQGRMNAGPYAVMTDGFGKMWEGNLNKGHKYKCVGSVLNEPIDIK